MSTQLPLILGSSSVFRKAQLARLGLPFQIAAPNINETPKEGESAPATALRLAVSKAQSLSHTFPKALIIGADQVAWCNGRQLGKPMEINKAQEMLSDLSGRHIEFYSAVCLLNSSTGRLQKHVDKTVVHMRNLTAKQIDAYLALEPDAVHCAGAAKSEGLGAALLERIESSDPNALIGLPIFKLIDFLATENISVL